MNRLREPMASLQDQGHSARLSRPRPFDWMRNAVYSLCFIRRHGLKTELIHKCGTIGHASCARSRRYSPKPRNRSPRSPGANWLRFRAGACAKAGRGPDVDPDPEPPPGRARWGVRLPAGAARGVGASRAVRPAAAPATPTGAGGPSRSARRWTARRGQGSRRGAPTHRAPPCARADIHAGCRSARRR
jgi:hypothetical protein